jgi:cupin
MPGGGLGQHSEVRRSGRRRRQRESPGGFTDLGGEPLEPGRGVQGQEPRRGGGDDVCVAQAPGQHRDGAGPGTIAATVNAAEPWGLALDAVPGAAFHAITDGTAWLCAHGSPGVYDEPGIRFMPGDIVLLPAGTAHTLSSAPGARTQPFDHLAAEEALAAGGELTVGTGMIQTRILCASYHQDPAVTLLRPAATARRPGDRGYGRSRVTAAACSAWRA